MLLKLEHEAELTRAVRRVPEALSDAAWHYIASRLRPLREITSAVVADVAREVVDRYGRRDIEDRR